MEPAGAPTLLALMPSHTEQAIIFAALAPVIYLLLLALGRWAKRSAGIPLGAIYQLFCIVLALYVPLKALRLNYSLSQIDAARELGAAAIVLGTLVVIAALDRFLCEHYFRRRRQTEIPKFLRQIAALLLFLVSLLLVLSVGYGKNITGFVFTSTVALGVIGFAMQDLLSNIIAGISLQAGKPFKAGDWLQIENQYAEVIEVNWRSTRLRNNDHVYLDIPNNQIVKNTIVNLYYPTRLHAIRIRVGVEYSAPPNLVKRLLSEAAASAKAVLQTPPVKVFLVDFGESAVIYEVKFWMEDQAAYNECCDSIRTHIWYGLDRAGIKIPFPIRTMHLERRKRAAQEIPQTVRDAVGRQPLFKSLDEAQTAQLLNSARLARFDEGEHLIDQGAEGSSMFILLDGEAEVLVERDGSQTSVGHLRLGDYFGEMSLLTGEERSATVRALSACEAVEIDKKALTPVLRENEKLLRELSELLAKRRMENEGVLASNSGKQEVVNKQREYTASFLAKLYSFFEL
jgi:small-conductance mechanosensitive channel/CRP-like cAMP-binding protein